MPRDAFVLKIQRELCHPKYARKDSGLSRNRPLSATCLKIEKTTVITEKKREEFSLWSSKRRPLLASGLLLLSVVWLSSFLLQEIGLASLGAPDEWIDKLATVRCIIIYAGWINLHLLSLNECLDEELFVAWQRAKPDFVFPQSKDPRKTIFFISMSCMGTHTVFCNLKGGSFQIWA